MRSCTPSFLIRKEKKYSWLDPAYSWNKQPAHTPFPKKINTPSTTLRFIGFVAKISVLNPKLPAYGQWPKKMKESVTIFIGSPLIDRFKNRTEFFFFSRFAPFLYIYFPISKQKRVKNRFDFEIGNYLVCCNPSPLPSIKKGRTKENRSANSSPSNPSFP